MSRLAPERSSTSDTVRVRELLRQIPHLGPQAVQELFCAELGYHPADEVLLPDDWPDQVRGLVEGPATVLARHKDGSGSFDVIHIPLATADTDHPTLASRQAERSIVNQLLEDHPQALFVFDEPTRQESHLVNVRYDAGSGSRSTLRRITVDPLGRLDAISRRVARLSISDISSGDQLLALAMQRHHDAIFDVEAVSAEFLKACRSVFVGLLADFQTEMGDVREAYDLALQFVSRLVAVYLLQAGGWLGSDCHFVAALWQAYGESEGERDTFVSEWLNVLFSRVFCGCFEEDEDAWRRFPEAARRALAAAPCLAQVCGLSTERLGVALPSVTDARFGDLLELMEAQRFTIREPTPLDQEVALDPGIIGLLQENLTTLLQDGAVGAPSDARQIRGVFYTPPVEIDLMCRLSLVDWLGNHLGAQHKPNLYRTVFAFDASEKERADRALGARGMWSSLRALLKGVRVLDPACGAGAFLVGILFVLDDLLCRADTWLGVQQTAIERKQHLVENNLYGIDVMDGAVEAARLRLCMQLASEAAGPSERERMAPLLADLAPKVVWGDSLLLGTEEMAPGPVGEHNALAEIYGRLQAGFDIVIGNPPYVRQELIRDPTRNAPGEGRVGSQGYKSKLSRAVYSAWPQTFQYGAEEDEAQWRLQARSDLYVYFYLQGLSWLKPVGTLCYLTSNAWLDAKYGRDLRRFLLTRGEVRLIIANAARRSFFNAEVNTVIGLFGPATDGQTERPESLDHLARFVTFAIPHDQLLRPEVWERVGSAKGYHSTPEWQEWGVSQAELLHRSRGPQEGWALGDRWGGPYLRAPHIYWVLEYRYGDKLKQIGEIADVRRGITTGANRFFFLDECCLGEWRIEDEFLAPVLRSPRDHPSVWLGAGSERPAHVFICHRERDELRGTRALDYISHGEALGYHLRPTCMSRRRWYDLGQRSGASVHCSYLVDQVMRVFASEELLLASDSFQEIYSSLDPALVAAACNSAICQLAVNVLGRSNFGGGLLKVQTYEVRDLLIPDPVLLIREVEQSFRSAGLLDLDGLDRRELDGIVFDSLGLTTGEREAVYEALFDLVSKRLAKARWSLQPGVFAAQGKTRADQLG